MRFDQYDELVRPVSVPDRIDSCAAVSAPAGRSVGHLASNDHNSSTFGG